MDVNEIIRESGGDYAGYIGVYDSGVGGISILKALKERMPWENFLYFGDSDNAPYGNKAESEIRALSANIADALFEWGCKAIVIACNTATSASAAVIRNKYQDRPVIGVEPAIKPASETLGKGPVLVMATNLTLKLSKFDRLLKRFSKETEFILCPCPNLAERIEKGNLEQEDLQGLLEPVLAPFQGKVTGVVLGCTHYPFVKEQIQKVVGEVPLFDSALGTAKELERELRELRLLKEQKEQGRVVFLTSAREQEKTLALYQELFDKM